jgi:small-conductance mechanosensitive channel
MAQFWMGIIIVLSGACWWLWNENTTLKENNVKLESAVQTQEETIGTLQNDFALQTEQMNVLSKQSQEAQREMSRYLDIFKRHNLTKLATAKPGLIETRANKATKEVFDGIEKITVDIDDLDDGLTVHPVPNKNVRG